MILERKQLVTLELIEEDSSNELVIKLLSIFKIVRVFEMLP